MDIQGERIILTEPEQLVADLPEAIARQDALGAAHRVLRQAESCAGRAEELSMSPVLGDRAQVAGLMRKEQFLRRMGAELADIGATTFGDSVETYLKEQGS